MYVVTCEAAQTQDRCKTKRNDLTYTGVEGRMCVVTCEAAPTYTSTLLRTLIL
jgi:hypothetical protein